MRYRCGSDIGGNARGNGIVDDALFGGGVGFDVPEGRARGGRRRKTAFSLCDDQKGIQDSLYADHVDYLSVLRFGARITTRRRWRFAVIRLGTVKRSARTVASNMRQVFWRRYRIPVLVRIEPERLRKRNWENADVGAHLTELLKARFTLRLKPLTVTGALYVDLDFYPREPPITGLT